jgi:hypothetical protein
MKEELVEIDLDISTYNFLLGYGKNKGPEQENDYEYVNWAANEILKEKIKKEK